MSENKDFVKQSLFLKDKKVIIITGIESVDSFDEFKISATNSDGTFINVEGENLSIKEVNLDTGTIEATGNISGFYYEEKTSLKNDSFIKKFFIRK